MTTDIETYLNSLPEDILTPENILIPENILTIDISFTPLKI